MIKLVSINLNYDFRGWYKAESIYENFFSSKDSTTVNIHRTSIFNGKTFSGDAIRKEKPNSKSNI